MKKRRIVLFVMVLALLIAGLLTGCGGGAKGIVNPPKAVGETVTFGEWRGKPLEWEVRHIQDGKALIITKDIVTIRQYDSLDEYGNIYDDDFNWKDVKVTWEDSDIRAWLNKEFISTAFSTGEISSILISDIENPDNTEYIRIDGGKDTKDRVFLLSIDEVYVYFYNDGDRIATFKATEEDKAYLLKIAKEDWGYDASELKYFEESLDDELPIGVSQAGWWWLRSPGSDGSETATGVDIDGSVYGNGDAGVYYARGGVRPALWINL